MHSARAGHTATLLPDGKVLIAGGFRPGEALASAELYDPGSGTFSPTGSMTTARNWHTATLLPNGKVLISGGAGQMTGILASAELYDPAIAKFVATGDMSVARALHYATLLKGGDVLIIGGVRGGGPNFFFSGHNYLVSGELYGPAQAHFSSIPGPGFDQHGSNGSAVLLNDGKVLIAGGIEGEAIVSAARLYDPAQNRFLSTGSMHSERFRHAATLLRDGRVLVTGGIKTALWSALTVTASAELYDPQRAQFLSIPDMATPRAYHTATLMPTGEVLITGGTRGSFLSLSSAELYGPRRPPKAARTDADSHRISGGP